MATLSTNLSAGAHGAVNAFTWFWPSHAKLAFTHEMHWVALVVVGIYLVLTTNAENNAEGGDGGDEYNEVMAFEVMFMGVILLIGVFSWGTGGHTNKRYVVIEKGSLMVSTFFWWLIILYHIAKVYQLGLLRFSRGAFEEVLDTSRIWKWPRLVGRYFGVLTEYLGL